MSTRAIQIESLLTGLVHPTTGLQMTGGTAYFYSAGTSTAKNVWTEKEKTNPFTRYTLSAIGGAQLYGDGEYKIVIKDADGVTCYTWDNVRLRFPNYYVRAVTSTTSQTADDDFLEVNTASGAVTINLLAVASWVQPLKVMHVAGANAINLEPYGAELIDSAANYSFTSVGTIVEVVADAAGTGLRKAGIRSTTLDADGDTGIELDRTADNDTVYIKTAGVDRMVINSTATDVDVLSIGGVAVTSSAAELNILDGVTASAAELNILDGVTASAAELNQCDNKTLVNTTDAQNIAGPKVFTDGLSVSGGTLSVYTTGVSSVINGISPGTQTAILAGPTSSLVDSASVIVSHKNDATTAGQVRVFTTDGTTASAALVANADGSVNVPTALQIGGVAVTATAAEINESSDGAAHTSVSAGGDLTGTLYLSVVGKTVSMTWSALSHSSSYTAVSSAGVVPSAYRPVSTTNSVYAISGSLVRMVEITSTGTVSFFYHDWTGSYSNATSTFLGTVSWVSN